MMKYTTIILAILLSSCTTQHDSNILSVENAKQSFVSIHKTPRPYTWHKENMLNISSESNWNIKQGASINSCEKKQVGIIDDIPVVKVTKKIQAGFYDTLVIIAMEIDGEGLLPFYHRSYRSAIDTRIDPVEVKGSMVTVNYVSARTSVKHRFWIKDKKCYKIAANN